MWIHRAARWLDMVPVCPRQAHAGTFIRSGVGLVGTVSARLSPLRQPAPCQAVPVEHGERAALGPPRFLDDRIDAIPVTRMVRYVPDCIRNRIGDGLVEPDTLPLQPRRPMRPGNFHAAIVSPPAAVTRVRYNKTPACLADCPALAGAGACFPQHPNERLGFACLSVCASLSSMVRIEAVARNQGGSLSRIQHTRHCSFANGRNRSASLNARKPPPNSVPQIRAGTLRPQGSLHPRFHQRTHCLGGQALIRGGKRILAACRACRCTEQYSLRTNRPCKRVKQRDMFEAA